jgi:hypothetical protein
MLLIRVPNALLSGYGQIATRRVEYRIESDRICVRFHEEMAWCRSRICHCLRSSENDFYICQDSGFSAEAYRTAKKAINLSVDKMKQWGLSDDEIAYVRAFMAAAMCEGMFKSTATFVIFRSEKVVVCKTVALAIREIKPRSYVGDMEELFGPGWMDIPC